MDINATLILTYTLLCLIIYKFLDTFLFKPYLIDRSFRQQNIPGRFVPFVGDILEMRRSARKTKNPLQYFTDQYQRYGSCYRSQLGPIPRLVISDPSLINYILKRNGKYYHKAKMSEDFLGKLVGMRNILFSEDEVHHAHRKMIQPVFQHHYLMSTVNLIVEITRTLLDKWKTIIDDNNNTITHLEIQKEMSTLTLDTVAGCIFGTGLINDQTAHEIVHTSVTSSLREMNYRFLTLIGILPIIKNLPLKSKLQLDKAGRDINAVAQKILDDRQQGVTESNSQNTDLLDLLLAAEHDNKKMTSEEVIANSVTMIFGGHETTSTALTWTIYCLIQYPNILINLQKEVDSVLNGQTPNAGNLSQLVYTEAVLKESLRLYPPVPNIMRQCIGDNIIVAEDGKEIFVREGTQIFLNFYNIHHSEKYYKDPKKFDPERFLTSKEGDDERKQVIFYPFSIGKRSCIGQDFAMIEAKIILAMIIQQFEFELSPDQTVSPKIFPIMSPKDGVWVQIKRRDI